MQHYWKFKEYPPYPSRASRWLPCLDPSRPLPGIDVVPGGTLVSPEALLGAHVSSVGTLNPSVLCIRTKYSLYIQLTQPDGTVPGDSPQDRREHDSLPTNYYTA